PSCPHCARALTHAETHVATGATPFAQFVQPGADNWSPASGANPTDSLPAHYATWEEFRELSPALASERIKLATNPLPDMRGLELLPLPESLPPKVDEFAQPLATLNVPGESKSLNWSVGTFIAVLGCFFLVFAGFQLGTGQVGQGPGRGVSAVTITSV